MSERFTKASICLQSFHLGCIFNYEFDYLYKWNTTLDYLFYSSLVLIAYFSKNHPFHLIFKCIHIILFIIFSFNDFRFYSNITFGFLVLAFCVIFLSLYMPSYMLNWFYYLPREPDFDFINSNICFVFHWFLLFYLLFFDSYWLWF